MQLKSPSCWGISLQGKHMRKKYGQQVSMHPFLGSNFWQYFARFVPTFSPCMWGFWAFCIFVCFSRFFFCLLLFFPPSLLLFPSLSAHFCLLAFRQLLVTCSLPDWPALRTGHPVSDPFFDLFLTWHLPFVYVALPSGVFFSPV